VTRADKCVFCGHPPEIVLIRTSDKKVVPACRQCVPKRMKLSWAENPRHLPQMASLSNKSSE